MGVYKVGILEEAVREIIATIDNKFDNFFPFSIGFFGWLEKFK